MDANAMSDLLARLPALHHCTLFGLLALMPGTGCVNEDEGRSTPGDVDGDGDGFSGRWDCDDLDPAVHLDATEICDGVDNDCDGDLDGASAVDASAWYADRDGDTFGDPLAVQHSCTQPDDHVDRADDCLDTDDTVHPYGEEVCNGLDDDCNGQVDDLARSWLYADTDGDGFGDPEQRVRDCSAPVGHVSNLEDCDDSDPDIHPDATEIWYDGIDQDCYGDSDYDQDGDGQDAEAWGGADCHDLDPTIYLGDFFPDVDGDSYGWPGPSITSCWPVSGYARNFEDCEDGVAAINPAAAEVCGDGFDNDCDGTPNDCGLYGTVTTAEADGELKG